MLITAGMLSKQIMCLLILLPTQEPLPWPLSVVPPLPPAQMPLWSSLCTKLEAAALGTTQGLRLLLYVPVKEPQQIHSLFLTYINKLEGKEDARAGSE